MSPVSTTAAAGAAQLYALPAGLRIDAGRAALALDGVPEELRARHLTVMVLSLAAASRRRGPRAGGASARRGRGH